MPRQLFGILGVVAVGFLGCEGEKAGLRDAQEDAGLVRSIALRNMAWVRELDKAKVVLEDGLRMHKADLTGLEAAGDSNWAHGRITDVKRDIARTQSMIKMLEEEIAARKEWDRLAGMSEVPAREKLVAYGTIEKRFREGPRSREAGGSPASSCAE